MFFPIPPADESPRAPPPANELDPAPTAGPGFGLPDEPVLRAFVGPNADYYLEAWAPALKGEGPARRFNFAALVFGPLWLAYRRIYWAAALVCVVYFAGVVADHLTPSDPETGPIPVVSGLTRAVVAIVAGLWGNSWYLARARRMLARVGRSATDDEARRAVARSGQTDLVGAIATLLVVGTALRLFDFVLTTGFQ